MLLYPYDRNNSLVGFNLDGIEYLYMKNATGEIVGILDINGNLVVTYTYDAWGKVLTVSGTLAGTVGTINPMRYRDYYLDFETGYYYLQSRYYNPDICRFINSDEPSIITLNFGNIVGANLFTYCNNNPVMNIDPTGHWRVSINVTWAGIILDALITWVLPYILTAFKATKLLKWAKLNRWFRGKYISAVKGLAKALYNGMDSIMYKIMGKAANAATRAFTLSQIQRWVESILNFSIGYGIAWIIDNCDKDGRSGYIRF